MSSPATHINELIDNKGHNRLSQLGVTILHTLGAVKRVGSVGVVGTVRERSTPWGDGVSSEKKIFFRGPG